MKEQISQREQQSIKIGIAANLVMAFSGWWTFYLSGSEALLLDGNMSFILFVSSMVALKISKIKSVRSEVFPFGLYVTEALYSMMKGLLLIGVIISAISGNGTKIFTYLQGGNIAPINTGPIVYYAIAMVCICWGLSLLYHVQNKRIGNASSMLKVDKKASFIDGVLSASTGLILIVIGYVPAGSSWDFLLYIGDALLVVILATLMIKQPIGIIKEAFIELAGGKLQDQAQHEKIETSVNQHLQACGISAKSLNISKTGSSYLVIVGLALEELADKPAGSVTDARHNMKQALDKDFNFVDVEMVLV
ncbi:putative Co/Zn/Cd cation transporter [Vibrio nigripulchritudo MADA3029]|uniref:Co/Zn/Cd cation transporter n=1 Tax=Vibrio nigripulchritudo SOn1 TaxID=1238450 RepID=A0AAV2VYB5_9VIBR|nr:cation transporter [Vibrio nigripulchritudo]CCN45368.1 putative Co/Zn/Cd cation transporter [Vibrio nigripulchritudo MADA3020]CCN51816.1 putative Co/Zn/Cd cation transporter [Vibrio nigripulchritudo MADA3021]CCN61980.1 putative Co/Zn/Cd cation transporter [Vibrio nigripulchritudo MADA3029]CCO49567.1 putative Co/Zn/Cd cation transporter [Vibrio nigripulchritudo SOn1]